MFVSETTDDLLAVALTVAAEATAATAIAAEATAATATTARGLGFASRRARGLLQRVRHDVRRQVQVFAKVFDALIRQVPVVMSPGEDLIDETLRLERLHELDHLQVRHIDRVLTRLPHLRVLRQVVILLGPNDTLGEERLVDLVAVHLRNKHGCKSAIEICLSTSTNGFERLEGCVVDPARE